MLEATQLEPLAALRRFTENALAARSTAQSSSSASSELVVAPLRLRGWQSQAMAGTTFDASERLGAIEAPTLVVTGTADTVVDWRNAELLAERIPTHGSSSSRAAGISSSGRSRSASPAARGLAVSGALTIDRWLRDRAQTTPRVPIDYLGREASYTELDKRSDQLAASLLAAGLRRGDRVATPTGNSTEHVEAFFACAKAGLVLVPLNWRLGGRARVPAGRRRALRAARGGRVRAAGGGRAGGGDSRSSSADLVTSRTTARSRRRRPGTTTRCSSSTRRARPARRRAPSSPTRTASGRTSASTRHGRLGRGRRAAGAAAVPLRRLERAPLLAWWKGARVVLERGFDASRCLALIAENA